MNKEDVIAKYNELLRRDIITPQAKQQRGREFETIVCELFSTEDLLIKPSYYTSDNRSEQIDGAIQVLNRIVLVEVKWVESNLAASELYSFIGKLENKLIGVLGLFISKEELSENFINAIHKGRRRNIIIMHGDDVEKIFSRELNLKKCLEFLIQLYSYDNILHYPIAKYIETQTIDNQDQISTLQIDSVLRRELVTKILSHLFIGQSIEDHQIEIELEDLSLSEKEYLYKYLLKKYGEFRTAAEYTYGSKIYFKEKNSTKALLLLVEEEAIIHKTFTLYKDLIIETNNIFYLIPLFWSKYKDCYLTMNDKKPFHSALVGISNTIIGNYNYENILTDVVEDVWCYFDLAAKRAFYSFYLEIYLDRSRKEKFEQKRFATKLFESSFEPKRNSLIEWALKKRIKNDVIEYGIEEKQVNGEIKYYLRYKELFKILKKEKVEEYLSDLYYKIIKEDHKES